MSGIAALILFSSVAVSADALEFGARGFYWFPTLKGDLRGDSGGVSGTQINLKDDLGMSNKNVPSAEVFAGIGKHHASLMYSQVEFSGSTTMNRDIVFNGTTYTSGTAVDSDFKLKMLDLEYQYDVLNLENVLAGFSVGVIGKIKYLDGEARLNSSAAGEKKETFGVPIPMVGAGVHAGLLLNILEARAKFTGIGYSGSVFYDGLAEISWTPFPFLDIHGGYRYMKLKVDNVSDIFADVELSGPYVGLSLSF
ncbi:MAG: hypothetical protein ACE14T_04655 [Syntrophales bacterium]